MCVHDWVLLGSHYVHKWNDKTLKIQSLEYDIILYAMTRKKPQSFKHDGGLFKPGGFL